MGTEAYLLTEDEAAYSLLFQNKIKINKSIYAYLEHERSTQDFSKKKKEAHFL